MEMLEIMLKIPIFTAKSADFRLSNATRSLISECDYAEVCGATGFNLFALCSSARTMISRGILS